MRDKETAKSDTAFVELLKNNREKAFDKIYKEVFPIVSGYIRKNSGTREEARDVFHDGIIILYEKIIDDKFTVTTTVSAFLSCPKMS